MKDVLVTEVFHKLKAHKPVTIMPKHMKPELRNEIGFFLVTKYLQINLTKPYNNF